jgi:hypothetical protein
LKNLNQAHTSNQNFVDFERESSPTSPKNGGDEK